MNDPPTFRWMLQFPRQFERLASNRTYMSPKVVCSKKVCRISGFTELNHVVPGAFVAKTHQECAGCLMVQTRKRRDCVLVWECHQLLIVLVGQRNLKISQLMVIFQPKDLSSS